MILLGVKSYALESAMNDFASAVGPETMILPVLDGMRHMDLLAARFGAHAVLGGVCIVATEIDQEGRIRQLADVQSLTCGEQDGSSTPRLRKLDGTLHGAGFDSVLSSHIMQGMWQKWVQLAALGAVTCLLRGPGAFGATRMLGHCQRLRASAIRRLPRATNHGPYRPGFATRVFDVSRSQEGRGRRDG